MNEEWEGIHFSQKPSSIIAIGKSVEKDFFYIATKIASDFMAGVSEIFHLWIFPLSGHLAVLIGEVRCR